MSLAEFLEWEDKQEGKWEYDGGPVAMTGGTVNHAAILVNVLRSLANRLDGTGCRPFGSELKFQTASGTTRYPDAMVVCVPVTPSSTVVTTPRVVFEVLSDSTVGNDKTKKLVEYLATPSVERYVMLEQNQALATVVARTSSGWSLAILGETDILAMPEISVEIPMAELYRGIAFPEPESTP